MVLLCVINPCLVLHTIWGNRTIVSRPEKLPCCHRSRSIMFLCCTLCAYSHQLRRNNLKPLHLKNNLVQPTARCNLSKVCIKSWLTKDPQIRKFEEKFFGSHRRSCQVWQRCQHQDHVCIDMLRPAQNIRMAAKLIWL